MLNSVFASFFRLSWWFQDVLLGFQVIILAAQRKYLLSALHGESLARSCLAVGYHGSVEALHHVFDQILAGHLKHLRGKTGVKKKGRNRSSRVESIKI